MAQWPCGLDEWLPQVSGLNGVILRIWRFDSWSSCWVSQNHQLQRPVPGQAGNFAQSVAGHHQPLEVFANGNLYRFNMPMFRRGQIESYISESGETRRRGQAMWCTFYLHLSTSCSSLGFARLRFPAEFRRVLKALKKPSQGEVEDWSIHTLIPHPGSRTKACATSFGLLGPGTRSLEVRAP